MAIQGGWYGWFGLTGYLGGIPRDRKHFSYSYPMSIPYQNPLFRRRSGPDGLRGRRVGCIGSFRRTEILAQGRLVDLAGGVARQGIDEFYQVRTLEAREVGRAVRMDLRLGKAVPRFHSHDSHAGFAPLFAGHADHGGLRDRGELVQYVLDLGRIDVFAAGNVHVLPAVDDGVEAFVVDPGGVAGMQPAVGERRGVGIGLVPVA